MKIGIIGAGISGITAGLELKNAGHDVLLFEKSRGFGGRMATRYAENDKSLKLDHGVPYFTVQSEEFKRMVSDLLGYGFLAKFEDKNTSRESNNKLKDIDTKADKYIAPQGMNSIGKFLGKNLDIRLSEKVIGLRHLYDSEDQNIWVIECESGVSEKVDAIIISTPASQALDLLRTMTDKTYISNIIEEIKKVSYDSQFALMLTYSHEFGQGIGVKEVKDDIINFISYESKKRDLRKSGIIVHSSPEFANEYVNEDRGKVSGIILDRLISLFGKQFADPDWKQVHFWRYSRVRDWLPFDYLETIGNDKPLAMVGSYMNGKTVESAYLSGLRLGKKWAKQLPIKQ